MTDAIRFPAEWEPQSAVLIAWPHADTDWRARLDEVEDTYIALVGAITRFEAVVLCVADDDVQAYARARLASARVDMGRVRFVEVDYDDTWLRDSGPITLRGRDGFRMLDFRFTGWGGKFAATRDDCLVESLTEAKLFLKCDRQPIDFALEGGAIETDGSGTLLTTWQCLHERHPDVDRDTLASRLAHWLHQDRVLWLDHGYLEGDDTDAHVDTLARFAGEDAIVYQDCDDALDGHYPELKAMADELAAAAIGERAADQDHERGGVDEEHDDRPLDPPLLLLRVHAAEAIDQALQRAQDRVEECLLAREHALEPARAPAAHRAPPPDRRSTRGRSRRRSGRPR